MGSRTWGQVEVPDWARRHKEVSDFIDDFECSCEDGGVLSLSHPEMCRDGIFPEGVHQALQKCEIPYDFEYLVLGDEGTRGGGWRPGMKVPLEFWRQDGERLFTLGEIQHEIRSGTSPAEQVSAVTALLEEENRFLRPLEQIADPRLERAETLRSETRGIAKSQRKFHP
jgi:hypothetical protein